MATTTLFPLRCMCGQLLHPVRGWLLTPRSIACSACKFTFALLPDAPDGVAECAAAAEATLEQGRWSSGSQEKTVLDRAVSLASYGLAKDPNCLACCHLRAHALQKTKLFTIAIGDWTACVKRGYRPAVCAFMRGIAYANTNQHEKAVEDYTRLLVGDLRKEREKEDVNRFSILMNRGMSLCEVGRFEEAEDEFSEVEPYSSPGGQLAYWQLVCRYLGDKDKAMKEYLAR